MFLIFLALLGFIRMVDENSNVVMEISIGQSESLLRIELELNFQVVPKTARNFLELCKGFQINGKNYSYKGSIFHRIIPQFMI